jgi:hypothetical protein
MMVLFTDDLIYLLSTFCIVMPKFFLFSSVVAELLQNSLKM